MSALPPEEEFEDILGEVFSPSAPVTRADMLKGRTQQLHEIEQTLKTKGRAAFVFGNRGVGKTSLALTAAGQFAVEGEIRIVSCDSRQTTFQIAKEIADAILRTDPLKSSSETKFNLKIVETTFGQTVVPEPRSINEAAKLIESALNRAGASFDEGRVPLIVVDEFDRLGSVEERQLVGDLLKQISDRRLPIRLIFCGVARSLDELLEGHGSAYRYIGNVELDPLVLQARVDILGYAEERLSFKFTRDQMLRIAAISDGFPYYVHLLGETVVKAHYDRCREFEEKGWRVDSEAITTDDFNAGVDRAISQCQGHLKAMYNKATKKYSPQRAGEFLVTPYEVILWAAAAQNTLERPGSAIFDEYMRLRKLLELRSASLVDTDEDDDEDEVASEVVEGAVGGDEERTRFNQRITRLKKPSHGSVLTSPRRGWWEFTEPMLRGYCRLIAKRHEVDLGGEISSR